MSVSVERQASPPSMSTSMLTDSMSSSLDSAAYATQTYKSALGSFINQQFAEAVTAIEPFLKSSKLNDADGISQNNWVRFWNLHIAILIKACEQEETKNADNTSESSSEDVTKSPMSSSQVIQTWSNETRQRLARSLQNNSVWTEAETSAGELHNIPPQVLVTLLNSSLAHSLDLAFIARKVETFFASTSHDLLDHENDAYFQNYLHVIELYSTKVLPRECEFDLALEFVQLNSIYPDDKKPALVKKIQDAKVDHLEQARAKKEESIKQEQAQLAQAQKEAELKEKAEALRQEERRRATEQQSLSQKESTDSVSAGNSQSKRFDTSTGRLSTWQNLRKLWSASFFKVANVSNLTKYFLPLAFFLVLFSRPAIRQRFKALLVAMWLKIAQTFSMGMKVSYV